MATNSQIAFNPQGKTVVVAAAAVAPLGVQVGQRSIPTEAELIAEMEALK